MDEIIGRKIGMTQVFSEDGNVVPVTVVEAGPCVVVSKRTLARDGYSAVALGFEDMREKLATRPYRGQFPEGIAPQRVVQEVKMEDSEQYNVGDQVKASIFEAGDLVNVSGVSKGKGFQGVLKRHGFSGGRETHGSNFHRRPGSIGQSATPSKVFKGTKLPGRMGGEKVTIRNLDIVQVDGEKNLLLIRGAVPGSKGAYLTIRKANSRKES